MLNTFAVGTEIKKPPFFNEGILKRCRGRDPCLLDAVRQGTFTRQLVPISIGIQSSVVNPGRVIRLAADKTALCYVYPVILTRETRGSLPKISSHKKAPVFQRRHFKAL